MKISIDTKEDSHDDLKKVIRILQHIVGDSAEQNEIFTNDVPAIADTNESSEQQESESPMANLFGEAAEQATEAAESPQEELQAEEQPLEVSASETAEPQQTQSEQQSDDIFAELFNEQELKTMNAAPTPQEEEEEVEEFHPAKEKKYEIEFY